METGYRLLTEKEEMWGRMLMEVLEDNGIPCAARPVLGAAVVIYSGARERLRIYVPDDRFDEAEALAEQLFSEDSVAEEESETDGEDEDGEDEASEEE
ncbi:MAG: DUF2007 domain-containing protein [Clostridia bacterium]|nr:DUF2007 domain-containing protein [Clostridia bacterium]